MARRIVISLTGLVIAGGAAVLLVHHFGSKPMPPIVKPVIATQPASQPTTRKAKPKYLTYMELVRQQNSSIAATQPLDFPVELPDSAHVVFHDPVYLDPTGNLWITRADGQPTAKALVKPDEIEDHIIPDKPIFVHWWVDDASLWQADVVVRGDYGGYDIITKSNRKHLADDRPYNWDTAFSILGKIVVTTDVGVSVFDLQPDVVEHYHPLPGCGPATNLPVTMLDTRGILAWAPWEQNKPGSKGVARFVDGKWNDLPTPDWPERPIQLSMLLDGSVLRMAAGTPASTAPVEGVVETETPDQFPDQIHLSIGQLEPPQLDQKHIDDLIKKLGDDDSEIRQAAFDELSRYGPELAPVLEKVVDDQLPEAKLRIRQLLRNKITPALGGLTLVDNRLDVIKRCTDGTVIFFAPSGAQVPTEHDDADLINPAWLALRADGRMERPLQPALIRDQKPEAFTIVSMHDEWINTDQAGPRRLVGSRFEPLLSPSEKEFTNLVGIDLRRRWVFRNTTGDTLVIDPLIADPTPKLPAWMILSPDGAVGWDSANFPALSHGDAGSNWELQADGWKVLPPAEKIITELPPATQQATPATKLATTLASTQPTTASAKGKPVLTTADGTRYFDCKTTINMVKNTGEEISWPLPPTAVGTADPTLIQTGDGLLFLFNQSGRLLRIRPTPSAAEPFKLEAVFTRDIPNTDQPTRIWLDPAGRIVFVSEDNIMNKSYNILTVTFPSGTIPKEISRMMLDEKP